MSKYVGPIDEGKDLITRDWISANQDSLAVMSMTYTGVYCTNSSYPYRYFLRYVPNDTNCMWHIRYRMFITSAGNDTYRGEYLVEWYGYRRTLTGYKIWNSRYNYPIYYHAWGSSNSDANAITYGNLLGVYIDSNNGGTSSTYARTIQVDVISYDGCSLEFLDNVYDSSSSITVKVSGTDTTFKISSYIGNNAYNATSNGLQETSDNDSYYLGYMNNARPKTAGRIVTRYSLVGMDANGNVMPFCLYKEGSSYSTGIQTKASGDRTYTKLGFDYTRGIFYMSSSGTYSIGSDMTASLFYYSSGLDLRYTDNCVASGTANSLGMAYSKPVYLRGKIHRDGLFYVYPTAVKYNNAVYQRAWVQDIPTEPDGFVYWLIGYPYYNSSYVNSQYQLNLVIENKLYKYYKEEGFREYVPKRRDVFRTNFEKHPVVKKAIPIDRMEPGIRYFSRKACIKFKATVTSTGYTLNNPIPEGVWDLFSANLGNLWENTYSNRFTLKSATVVDGYVTEIIYGTKKGVSGTSSFSPVGTVVTVFGYDSFSNGRVIYSDGSSVLQKTFFNEDSSSDFLHIQNGYIYCDKVFEYSITKNRNLFNVLRLSKFKVSFRRSYKRKSSTPSRKYRCTKWTLPRRRLQISGRFSNKTRVYAVVKHVTSIHYSEVVNRRMTH